jgi:hypothetical protein
MSETNLAQGIPLNQAQSGKIRRQILKNPLRPDDIPEVRYLMKASVAVGN